MDIAIFRLRRLNITMYLEEEIGSTSTQELYKFFDREGNILALRPDITPSVARAAATLLILKIFRFVFVMSETLLSIIQAIAAS